MPILREAFAELPELSKTLFTKALETQRLASTVARSNSASHSPWVVRQDQVLVFYKN
ncbi:hypothetical protein LEP1GSC198_1295 [Leptospira kirschneri str. JB]|nr:hypothetical protein LEP1GSC198_3531 [Leptospira kirschneri str. JB]EMJ90383.1 hypothetical protein LEP1GSC198_1295 [Leptospira kirschneri str. JB]